MGAEAEKSLHNLLKDVKKYQLESLLSGEADGNDAYLEVNAGAGGPDGDGLDAHLDRHVAVHVVVLDAHCIPLDDVIVRGASGV